MPKNLTAAALIGFCLSGTALGESWLCVGEQDVGYTFKQGRWQTNVWNAGKFKMVIRVPTTADKAFFARPNVLGSKVPSWVAVPLGEEFPTMSCDASGDSSFVICDGGIEELRFNRFSLRFQYVYRPGYINTKPGSDQSGDNPQLLIGICSAI